MGKEKGIIKYEQRGQGGMEERVLEEGKKEEKRTEASRIEERGRRGF